MGRRFVGAVVEWTGAVVEWTEPTAAVRAEPEQPVLHIAAPVPVAAPPTNEGLWIVAVVGLVLGVVGTLFGILGYARGPARR